ncbi:MAG: hypothetical protein RI911_386 [Candidatus Parcubacteria bacterium]|jgi:hypothetical protein
MDLEKLNKTQIVLLTLLVSFVTSIATGIVTVSLVQQAPPAITQTVNRVIEKTVERVVEKDISNKGGEPKFITKEKVILVKEADFVADAVKGTVPSLVTIYELRAPEDEKAAEGQTASDEKKEKELTEKVFVARGVFMGASLIISDESAFKKDAQYIVKSLATGTESAVESVKFSGGAAYLTIEKAIGGALSSADSSAVQLGQTLILLGGAERLRVTTDIVSDMERAADGSIQSITLNSDAISGNALISMDGKLVAIYVNASWLPLVK